MDNRSKQITTTTESQDTLTADYFRSLPHYKPLCYTGRGPPLFLVNQNWYQPFLCVLATNAIFIILFYLAYKSQRDHNKHQNLLIANFILFGITNLCYLLTQFLNPGILYPLAPSFQALEIQNLPTGSRDKTGSIKTCIKCNANWSLEMDGKVRHCTDCKVCMIHIDHHCGWFGRCVAGFTTWTYYGFMLGLFALFGCLAAYTIQSINI